MNIEQDRWLTEIFGIPVYRLGISPDDDLDQITAAEFPIPLAPKAFLYVKVPVQNVNSVSALTSAGFRVIDVNVTLEREPSSGAAGGDPSIYIRDFRAEDQETVLDIAGTCFIYSRFHLDPLISDTIANAVKREWIANYFRKQRGERLLVAEVAGKPAGFLAILATGNSNRTGIIDLIGVDRAYQKRGVGYRLVEFFTRDSQGKYDQLRVGTQIANTSSIRLYEKCGFHTVEADYVLHAHLCEGKVMS